MWRTSGIHRDVLLVTKPSLHISDFVVATPLIFGTEASTGAPPPLTSARLESNIYLVRFLPCDEQCVHVTANSAGHPVRMKCACLNS